MDAITALKNSCKSKKVSFKNFSQIELGVYNIEEFSFLQTKFGVKLVVRTENFMCFLPDRCSNAITTDEQIAELNGSSLAMQYEGRDEKRGDMILVNIIDRPQTYIPLDLQISDDMNMSELITFGNNNMESEPNEDSQSQASTSKEKSKKRKLN